MNQNVGLGSISYTPNNNFNLNSNIMTSTYPISTPKFGPRALRSETRAKAKDEIKKVKNTIQKVKKWEKRLVVLKDSSLSVYKWVPISSSSPSVEQNIQGETQNSNLWKKFNASRNNQNSNTPDLKFKTTELPQINKTKVNESLYKFASHNLANRSVLNHDENAQDSLSICDRGNGKMITNQSLSPNNEGLINENNSSSSSLTFCSNRLLEGNNSVTLIDLNNNNVQVVSSDSESSNQNSNDNLDNCETFTQIETINNRKIPPKQINQIANLEVKMPLTAYYETFFNN